MGLTSSDIKNPVNKPIIFVKIHFYDLATSAVGSLLFSDFSKSFSDGTDPIVALSAVPFFAKEIDPIESNTIIKSGYKITLNNADGALTSLFSNKIFNGQKIEFFLSTEASSNEELVATGIYSSIVVEDNITLTIAEVIDLTKKNTLNLFNTGKNEGDAIPVYKGKNDIKTIGVNGLDGWVDTGLNGTIRRKPNTNWFRLYLDDFEALNRLRSNVFDGDKIIIEGLEDDYEFSLASSLLEDTSNFSLYEQKYVNLKIEKGELANWLSYDPSPATPAPGNIYEVTGNILIKTDDGLNYNDEFLVTDDCSSPYEETSITDVPPLVAKNVFKNDDNTYTGTLNSNHGVKEYSVDNQWVEVQGDWNWLSAGDRVQVLLQKQVSSVWHDYSEEELTVDHWDKVNNRIYFTDQLSHKVRELFGFSDWRSFVRFYKVQKIAINDLGDLEIKKNHFDISLSDLSSLENFPFKNNGATSTTTHPLIPYLQFKAKPNCMQILANLARINRRDPETLIMSYSQVTMPFQVSNFQQELDYGISDSVKCRVVYNFSPDVKPYFDARSPQGEWNKPQSILNGSQSFWLLQVRSGICTYGDIIQLAYDDVNCPWEFSIASGSPVTGSSVINFDSRRTSVGTSNTANYVYMNSGDMSLFPVGTEVSIVKADKSAMYFAVVKVNNTGSNRLEFNTLVSNPGNGCIVTKKVIAEKSVTATALNTGATISTTTSICISAADYKKFFKSDILLVNDLTNGGSYTQVTGKTITSGKYYLTVYPALPFAPTDGTIISLRNFTDAWAFNEFATQGFFSADVCARTSEFNPYNDNNMTNKLSSNMTGESNEDKLIRSQNEVHKAFFVWYLEKGGPADNEDYQNFDDLAFKSYNPYTYYNGGFYDSLPKRNAAVSLPNIGNKYGTVINLCPNFSLEYPSNYGYGWGGVNTSDGVNPPAFGYVAGTSTFDRLGAWCQAIANQINSALIDIYFFDNSWGKRKIPFIAVPFHSNDTGWVVRVKHCFFNNCNKVDDSLWDRANTALQVKQEEQNYSPAVPFIRDNALYLKLDRKAITLAVGDKNLETLQFQSVTVDGSSFSFTTNEGYYNQGLNMGSSLLRNLQFGNYYQNPFPFSLDSNGYLIWLEQNPVALLDHYNAGNPNQIFNVINPLVLSTEPGTYSTKSGFEMDRFTVLKNPHPLFPDTHFFNIEEMFKNYYSKSTGDGNWDKGEVSQQSVYMSLDLAYYFTNFKSYRGPDLSRPIYYLYRYGLGAGEYWQELVYNSLYAWVEVSDVTAYYKDAGSNLGDLLSSVCSLYGITGVDTSAIKALGINAFLKISDNKEFYKTVAPLLQANSIVCFTDKNGAINFKQLNLKGVASRSFSEYDCLTFDRTTDFPAYSHIEVTYGENNDDSKNLIEEVLNPSKDSIFEDLDFDNPVKFNSNTLDVLNTNAKDLLVQKYTENNDYLEVSFGMEYWDININDAVSITSGTDTDTWVVVKKELDFNTVKLKLIRGI